MSIYTQVLINNGSGEVLKRTLEIENPLHEEFAMISPSVGVAVALLHVHGGIEVMTECVHNAIDTTCDVFDEPFFTEAEARGNLTIDTIYKLDMLCLRGYEQIVLKELVEDIRISAMSSDCRYRVKPQFAI